MTSVVIATYNRGERIGRTLDSVLSQTTPSDEVVVVDDASTDGTGDWVRARYPQVAVYTFPNGGTSLARNRGAAKARGSLLVFLDHDDDLLPGALETLTGLLSRHPEARAAFADHELKDVVRGEFLPNHHTAVSAFHRMRSVPALAVSGTTRTYGSAMYRALLSGNLLQQPWAIYRQDFLDLGGFDPAIRYCEDWDLYMRLTRERVVAVCDDVISTHYIEGANLHRAAGQNVQHMKVLRKHIRINRLQDWSIVRTLRTRLANYYKAIGDERRLAGEAGAWWAYAQSFGTWPFDPVVAARCVLWMPSAIGKRAGRRRTAAARESQPPS